MKHFAIGLMLSATITASADKSAAVTLEDLGYSAFEYTLNGNEELKLANPQAALTQAAIDLISEILTPTPQAGDVLPRMSVKFSETAWQSSLRITGLSLPPGDNEGLLSVDGAFWSYALGLRFRNPNQLFRDGVFVSGSGQHDVGPHSNDGFSTMQIPNDFQFPDSVLGDELQEFSLETGHPNKHVDTWTGKLTGSTTGTQLNTWTLVLTSAHAGAVVPVPASLSLLLTGLAGLGFASRKVRARRTRAA